MFINSDTKCNLHVLSNQARVLNDATSSAVPNSLLNVQDYEQGQVENIARLHCINIERKCLVTQAESSTALLSSIDALKRNKLFVARCRKSLREEIEYRNFPRMSELDEEFGFIFIFSYIHAWTLLAILLSKNMKYVPV